MLHYLKTILFLMLSAGCVTAQEIGSKKIYGKIVADYPDLDGVYIINLATEKGTATERGGFFSIHAAVGDTLLFSAVQFKGIKVPLKAADFENDLFLVKMEILVRKLAEVRVMQYKNINAVSLGIIPASTKHFTPAERRLNAASNTYLSGNTDGTTGGSIGVDPLLNLLSGRTAMLEKQVAIEKKEALLKQIEVIFGERYSIEKLKIPEDYVKGFNYFLVEDKDFVTELNSKNTKVAAFLMGELATKYIDLIK